MDDLAIQMKYLFRIGCHRPGLFLRPANSA
jgi:hypothetical protein